VNIDIIYLEVECVIFFDNINGQTYYCNDLFQIPTPKSFPLHAEGREGARGRVIRN